MSFASSQRPFETDSAPNGRSAMIRLSSPVRLRCLIRLFRADGFWGLARLLMLAGALLPLASAKSLAKTGALPAGFVFLRDVAPDILQDMRYASRNNFTGHILPGYEAAECVLRREAALALRQAQKRAWALGYSLKVYDCYRPDRAVKAFARWASERKNLSTKFYYPRLPKSALHRKGYIARRSSHSRGYAVDLTLAPLPSSAPPTPATPALAAPPAEPQAAPQTKPQAALAPNRRRASCIASRKQRPQDNSIDMGTAFDCFDVRSHTDHPSIKGRQRANRQLLKRILERSGFRNYWREWWHYSHIKRNYPRRYYNFPIRR